LIYDVSLSGININPDLCPEFSVPLYLVLDELRLLMNYEKPVDGEL
jgi:hypothetical protein